MLDTSAPDSLAESSVFGASAFSAALSPALAAVPINRNPVANSDSYSTRPNQPLTVVAPGLLGNDKDPDGDSLSVSVLNVTGLSGKGVISSGADGSFTFTPNAGFAGDATFTYTISDGFGGSDTASAVIHVTNAAPDAIADEFFVHAGRVLSVAAPGLLANDKDSDGDSLSVSVLNVTGLSGKGVINPRADGGFTFTPNAGFIGDATFTYSISDGFGGSDTANAVIHVTNAAPDANADEYSVHAGRVLTVAAPGLLANDKDSDGDSLSVSVLNVTGLSGKGVISPRADGSFTFTPNAGFAGDATFTYTISDGFGGSSTANAVIHVTNAAPVASDDHFSTRGNRALTLSAPGLLVNDRDADGDALRVSATNTAGLQGSLSSAPDGGFTFTPRLGFVGTTKFSYTVSDGNGGTATAVASIDVVNQAPDANADEYSVHAGRVLTVAAPGLLANDKDSDRDSLSVSSLNVTGLSGKGVISPRADGSFTFTPNAGFAGDATFTYTISDGFGGSSTANAVIHVTNAAPVASDDHFSTRGNRALTLSAPGLLVNDRDADGDALRVSATNTAGLQGSLSSAPDGGFTFTPRLGFVGTTKFSYTVSDGNGGTATAVASIDVVNQAPDANADEYFVHAGGVLTVAAPGLLANDTDADGDSLSVSSLNVTGLSGKGVISPRADGSFTFTPNAGFVGDATFTYTINDGFGGNATATALVHVGNAAPVAVEDSYSVHVGRTLAVAAPGLLANDSDANGDPLQVTSLNVTGLQGTVSPFADGHFSFTPTAGFTGTTSFNYTISDGFGGTSTAKVNIDVFNNKPVVNNDTYNIRPNQVLSVAAPGLLANDSDPDGDTLSVVALDVSGLRGNITPFADGHFSFTPTVGFAGTTSFKYTVSDGAGGTATGTTTINVVNAAPVAVNDSYAVHTNKTLSIAAPGLLANDRDADGDPLQVTSLNVTGLQGTLSPFADGHFSFTPTAGFTGTTSFNYTISDGFGGTSTAKVNIDVFNNPPIVTNDTYNMRPNQVLSVAAPGLLANDSDPDGDTLSVVALDVSGLRGNITPFADGHFSFTPTVGFAGTTSFKYTVSDGAGGTATGTTTINVVNAAPVAVNDSYAVHTNQTLSIAAPGLLANDRDADGDPLQVTSLNVTGLQGTLSPFADGHFSFTPTAGFTGTTSFNYTISDGFGGTSTATVKIDVFNNKPVVNNDTYNIRPNEVLSVAAPGLLANDIDPDGDTLSVVALDVSGLRGSITPFADGHFSFTPTVGFAGTTSFKYTVSDGAGGTATGTATINLVNSSPVAVNDRYAVYAGQTLEVAAPGLLANDSDADGDALTAKLADVTGLQGSISLLADGHFIFTPKAGFTGRTSFSYTTSDGFGGTATATAAIDVVPIPTKTVSIGNAPDRQSGLGGQWAAAWTNADIVTSIVHKADYTNATETWSAVRLNGVSPQTLAGGDIYAGDLGVSGQSEASSPVRQEIDGKEALRFNLAESATGLTVYLSRLFTQDDGGDFVESGRLRLLDADGHVVKETSFRAGGAAGTQAITLTSDLGFSAIELSAGVYDGSTFVPGGYAHADGSFAATVTSDAVGVKHGSDFLVDKIDFQVPVLGVPLTDVFAP